MHFREATIDDIPQMMEVRLSVKENALSNPALVPAEDYKRYLDVLGKGWVAESNNKIAGFAIVDLTGSNVWALFVHPDFEAKGIGKKLHHLMLGWYFKQTQKTIWLSTGYQTRAFKFYQRHGWKAAGAYSEKEMKFEMDFDTWQSSMQSK